MRILPLPLLLLLLAATALAEPKVGAEASLDPAEGIVVGQRVVLRLELSTATWFRAAATLPDPAIPGAIVIRYGTAGVNGSRQVDGETWTTQTWEWLVFPTRAGRFAVPAMKVVVRPPGEDNEPTEVPLTTRPLAFEVAVPEGGEGKSYAFAASGFRMEESLDPKPEGLKVGDALRRTLTLTIDAAPGMLIPPLEGLEVEGASAYPDAPKVDDRFVRGSLTGQRVESVAYVLTREGAIELQPVKVVWWDLVQKTLRETVVEGRTIEVRPNPEFPSIVAKPPSEAEGTGPSPYRPWRWLLAALVGFVVLSALVRSRDAILRAVRRLVPPPPPDLDDLRLNPPKR